MSVINLNLNEVLNEGGYELLLKDKYKTEASLAYDRKNIQKNRLIFKSFFKTDFIKNVYEKYNNKPKLFFIDKSNEGVIFNDPTEEFVDDNLKDKYIYYRDIIQDGYDTYYFKFRPLKIVKSLIPRYRDTTLTALLLDKEKLLYIKSDEYFKKLGEVCNAKASIDFLNYIKENKYVTCIYEITVEKLNKTTFDYYIDNRTLKQRVLSEEELIELCKNENLAVNNKNKRNKKKNKRNKNKRNKNNDIIADNASDTVITEDENDKENNELISDDESETVITEDASDIIADNASDTVIGYDLISEDENEIIDFFDIPKDTTQQNYNSDNENDIKYGEKPHVNFSNSDYFSYEDKEYIISLLNKLYDNNETYKSYISNNLFTRITVLKNFHYDKSFIDKSLHFNIWFNNRYSRSSVKHVYIKDEAIQSITEINNILD